MDKEDILFCIKVIVLALIFVVILFYGVVKIYNYLPDEWKSATKADICQCTCYMNQD